MDSIVVATRIYGQDFEPKTLTDFLASVGEARSVLIAVELKEPLMSSVEKVVRDHENVRILPCLNMHVFSPALNLLMREAMSDGAKHILYQSLEVRAAGYAVSRLRDEMGEDTLVCGAALPGHQVAEVVPGESTMAPLTGTTCPWNTFALWSLPHLARTGFLSISDVGKERGVEEAAVIAVHQQLFPESSEAKLISLRRERDLVWLTPRRASHAAKMESKERRAAAQLRELGLHHATKPQIKIIADHSYVDPVLGIEQETVLVTGGAGFIGSHTSRMLLQRGNTVVIVDDFNDYYDPKVKEENVLALEADFPGRVHVSRTDIVDREAMAHIFAEHSPKYIIHLAARAGVRPSLNDPHLYVQANIVGTTVLLELARQHGVRHFVFASSSSVYGGSQKEVLRETDRVDSPISPYAASKKACELLASTYHHLFGINASGLRFFTVYGERGRPDMAPFKFLSRAIRGTPIDQYGDGSSERDYTYVADIADGIVRALDRPNGYQVYNLGAGQGKPVSLLRFLNLVQELVQKPLMINILPDQPGDVRRTSADISKAKAMLGYDPKVSFETGLRRTFEWLNEQPGMQPGENKVDEVGC
eukprot:g825.t1